MRPAEAQPAGQRVKVSGDAFMSHAAHPYLYLRAIRTTSDAAKSN